MLLFLILKCWAPLSTVIKQEKGDYLTKNSKKERTKAGEMLIEI